MPEQLKDVMTKALTNGSRTEELPFLHNKINGLILPAFVTEQRLRACSTFPTRPGDVFLVTYPKSGTIWLSEIVNCITQQNDTETVDGKKGFLGGITDPLFEVLSQKELDSLVSPRYMATHLSWDLMPHSRENSLKYIYIARNPKDVSVSYFYFMKSLPLCNFQGTWDKFLECFMKGDVPYGSYFDHVLEWWGHKDDENVLFLKYEDLKKDLSSQVKIIAEFIGFQLSDEEAKDVAQKCTFQAMKSNNNMRFFVNKFIKKGSHLRKGIVGDWKNHFSDEQLEQFQKLYESRMNGSGLDFEFQM
ncbi:MAG: sulfotransferase domain-containing protein [Nostochopsis sp.]